MKTDDRVLRTRICSLAFVLLAMSASLFEARATDPSWSAIGDTDSKHLSRRSTWTANRIERRSMFPVPRIIPTPLIWNVNWSFLWYLVDPDQIPSSLRFQPDEAMRKGAFEAATRAIEVYYLLHPGESALILSEIRRLAILESQPNLPENEKLEEQELKRLLYDYFQENPTLRESAAAIFLANAPARLQEKFRDLVRHIHQARQQDSKANANSNLNEVDIEEIDPLDVKEPVIRDWAHVQLVDPQPSTKKSTTTNPSSSAVEDPSTTDSPSR